MRNVLLFLFALITFNVNAQIQNFNTKVKFNNVEQASEGDSIQVLVRDGNSEILKWISKKDLIEIPSLDEILTQGNETKKSIFFVRDTTNSASQWKIAIYSGNDDPKEKGGQFTASFESDGYLTISSNINSNTLATTNLYYGTNALRGLTKANASTSANNNVFGTNALSKLNGGNGRNTSFGAESGILLIDGSFNSFFGYRAGYPLLHGNNNTIIGRTESGLPTTLNDNIIIATGKAGVADIGFRVTETGLTTVPKQTQTTFNSDSSGKAVVTKEILNNAISSIPTIDDSNFLKKDENNTVNSNFGITSPTWKIGSNIMTDDIEISSVSNPSLSFGLNNLTNGLTVKNSSGNVVINHVGLNGSTTSGMWSLSKNPLDTQRTTLTFPENGYTSRTLPISVNGNYSDTNGNITLTIPTIDDSNFLKKDESNLVTEGFEIKHENTDGYQSGVSLNGYNFRVLSKSIDDGFDGVLRFNAEEGVSGDIYDGSFNMTNSGVQGRIDVNNNNSAWIITKDFSDSSKSYLYFPQTGGIPRRLALSVNGNYADANGNIALTIPTGLSLGETSTTAYRGDRGKTAYDYSQIGHVPLAGNSTISGVKTFTASPIVPNATTSGQAVNFGQLSNLNNSTLNYNWENYAGNNIINFKVGGDFVGGIGFSDGATLEGLHITNDVGSIEIGGGMTNLSIGDLGILLDSPGGVKIGTYSDNYVLPNSDGLNGQVLITDGDGTTEWKSLNKTYTLSSSITLAPNVDFDEDFFNICPVDMDYNFLNWDITWWEGDDFKTIKTEYTAKGTAKLKLSKRNGCLSIVGNDTYGFTIPTGAKLILNY